MIYDTAHWLGRLWEAAEGIRDAVPIAGVTATDAECRDRNEMVAEWLGEFGIITSVTDSRGNTVQGRHVWHSVLFEDGTVAGKWCDNEDEAALDCMVWWGKRVRIVQEDPHGVARSAWKAANGETVRVAASGEVVPSGGLLDLLEQFD